MTTPGTDQEDRQRPMRLSAAVLAILAAAALLTGLVIGDGRLAIGRSSEPGSTATRATSESSRPQVTPTLRQTSISIPPRAPARGIRGWPHTGQNPPGRYSWDGRSCAGRWCVQGFMHNGYGSTFVRIFVGVASSTSIPTEGRTATTVAGHDGLYARIDARTEEWVVRVNATTLAIRLEARPGAIRLSTI